MSPCRATSTLATMLRFLRRRFEAPMHEGTTCQWCRTLVPATTDEQLFLAGAVLDPVAGWFCSDGCARQYALRFRVQPSRTPPGGTRASR